MRVLLISLLGEEIEIPSLPRPPPPQSWTGYWSFKKLSRWRYWSRPSEGRAAWEGRVLDRSPKKGGSEPIFSSGSGHVTGVTSPNVVVGGGGERSRRSRRKDGGAVEEALLLLLPPLLSPPPAKPELEPQRVSAPHPPGSHLPRSRDAPQRPVLPPSLPAGSPRPCPFLPARAPSQSAPPGSVAGARRVSPLARRARPSSSLPCRAPSLQVREGPIFPHPATPNGPQTSRGCLICLLPGGS